MAVLLAGCATPAALSSEASAAQLGAAFGACSAGGPGEGGSPIEAVAATKDWVAAAALNTGQRPDSGVTGTRDVEVQTVSGGKETVRLHSSFWPGIEWAFNNDAKVWLAMADPEYWEQGTVGYVLVETAGGEVFFPGECLDEILRIPLHDELGPESDKLLAGLPLVEPGKVRDYLGIEDAAPEEQHPDRVILNPDDVDAAVLEPLTLIGIYLKTSGEIGDGTFTICTRIPAGWNECVMADEKSTLDGWNFNAYIDDSGELEFWLLNGDADVSQPFGKIGEVNTRGKGIEVFVDTSTIGVDGTVTNDDLVTLAD
ncbi:hypothetical protein [Microbacterium fluvii]|uniref:hypothetical protein n=1 Tax=Microbacterium fluvii TaxID=415215 RepID=UPI0021D0F116|nr:hypothetical protein [Microbacterium fluvii]MCU4672904.1 hypothetical protein [Microbacterium fluvii]